MKNKHILFLLLISLISISSCTMEKRHYQSGYYIDWKNNVKNTAAERTTPTNIERINAKTIETTPFSASTNEDIILTTSTNSDISTFKTEKNTSDVKASEKAQSKLTVKDKIKVVKAVNKMKKATKRSDADGIPTVLLFVLAVLLPPLAVGLVTDWDLEQTLISVGLTFLCWLPGIIHAIIVVDRNRGY
ncbi:MAG: hypothetical protein RL516_375 [Bacteroidota bacterium]|jgi:uncharacterized membrane protein YqaE (UPF0057 family)